MRTPRRTRRLLAVLAVLALTAAACGDDDEVTSVDDTTTTTAADDGTDDTTDDAAEEIGEPIEIAPFAGDVVAVVGIPAGDVLRVTPAPGAAISAVLAELEPLAEGLVATGRHRAIEGEGIWSEIEVDGVVGWVPRAHLAFLGVTDDVTTQVAPTPADRPTFETPEDLAGWVVMARVGTDEEGPAARIGIVDGPTVGDLVEMVVDVIGFGDDAVLGERLRVFAEPVDGGVTLRSVEATVLCDRGVTDEGFCV